MYVCMYILALLMCMYVCMYVCKYDVYIACSRCWSLCMCVCMCVYAYVCIYEYGRVRHTQMLSYHAEVYVCMYNLFMYVCVCICVYTWVRSIFVRIDSLLAMMKCMYDGVSICVWKSSSICVSEQFKSGIHTACIHNFYTLRTCMNTYVCIQTKRRTYKKIIQIIDTYRSYIYTYIHTYIHIYIQNGKTCTWYIHTCTHTYIHTSVYTYIRI
jgi:hypothetical protein